MCKFQQRYLLQLDQSAPNECDYDPPSNLHCTDRSDEISAELGFALLGHLERIHNNSYLLRTRLNIINKYLKMGITHSHCIVALYPLQARL